MGAVQLTGVRKLFGALEVIKGVDLSIADGELVVFVGPSGCGKSTLLRMIAGLEDVDYGDIRIAGADVTELAPARRGVAMFKRVEVPILGVIENMSYFLCPECGTRSDIFGHGGARHEAERLGVPFLGEIPLHMEIREKSDAGLPVVATEPDGPHAKLYRGIAEQIKARLEGGAPPRAMPRIVIE